MSRVALAVVEGCGLLGLRRLFRQPYSGPICVIEIVGVELKPSANCGTACSLYPAAPRPSVCCATRRASEPPNLCVKPPTLQHRWSRLAVSLRHASQWLAGPPCGVDAWVGLWRDSGQKSMANPDPNSYFNLALALILTLVTLYPHPVT